MVPIPPTDASLEGFVVVGLVGTVLGCFVSYVENYTVDASIFVA